MREPIMVSVVVPAFNSASTIRRTLDSLLAQTFTQWEALVVDDGSSDDTTSIVAEYERSDPRIVLLRQPHGGASASRNAGIARARQPWLYFLDSDDWIHPRALERLTSAVSRDPDIDAAVCGWALVTSDGSIIEEGRCSPTPDLFPLLARRSAFVIHACLVRRDLVLAAGGLDAIIRPSQDWVLWQRVARLGARFGHVNETLAFYLQRQNSLSSDPVPLFDEAVSIIELGHGPDARVPHGANAAGRPAFELPGAQLNYLCWVAGMMLARERDPAPLLKRIAPGIPQLEPSVAAESLYRAVPAALGRSRDLWDALWPRLEPHIDRFLVALELHMTAPGHARSTRLALEGRVLDGRLRTGLTRPGGVSLGAMHATRVEITSAVEDISVGHSIERVRIHVDLLGEPLGVIELPAFDGVVRFAVLRDSIADRFAWILLGRFFASTVYSQCEFRRDSDGWSVWRDGKRLAAALPEDPQARADTLHDAAGWSIFLEELWKPESPPLLAALRVESITARAVATVRRWLRGATHSADDWIVVQAGEPGVDIRSARPSVAVALRVGRSTLGGFDVPVHQGKISSAALRQWLTDAAGFELCRVSVCEALIGTSWSEGGSLGDRLARRSAASRSDSPSASPAGQPRAASPAVSFAPGSWDAIHELAPRNRKATVIARRAARPIGGSASRVAMLPGSLADLVSDCEPLTGNPIVQIGDGEPSVVYAASVVWRPLHPPTPAAPVPAVAAHIMWKGRAETPRGTSATGRHLHLPILMYHRVAAPGSPDRVRASVTPDMFERQLSYLRECGFTSITLNDWRETLESRRPTAERPILITFDDGYADFAEHAWPLLRSHDLSALLMIVTGSAGGTNNWDHGAGDERLLDWPAIARLHNEGVEIGAHSVTHRRMTSLTPTEIAREALEARAALERALHAPVLTFAYPYGEEDELTRHVVGAAGYAYALSRRPGPAVRHDPWLALPRIEVTGFDDLRAFISKLAP